MSLGIAFAGNVNEVEEKRQGPGESTMNKSSNHTIMYLKSLR
jgi:hypothetical protein